MSYIFRLTLSLFLFSLALAGSAQKLEKVQPYIKAMHDSTWYKTQRDLWYKEIQQDSKNEEAWLNYALAARYYMMTAQGYSWGETSKALNSLMDEMQKSIPGTFTYNLMKARSLGSWDKENGVPYAEEAYRMRPNDPMALREIIVRYELFFNLEKRKEANIRYFNSNDPSPAMTNYNYNVLASLKPNAILFTQGDNDTYPIWMIQDVLGYRTDVMVINISLAGINEYRGKLFKQLGITLSKEEEALLDMPTGDAEERARMEKNIITIMSKHTTRPIYVGLTACDGNLVNGIKSNLYVTGLASLYSTERIDNVALIQKNFEKDFLVDYLKVGFRVDEWAPTIIYCNQNYITPCLILYKHYVLAGETEKAERMKVLMLKIGKDCGREEDVLKELK